MIAGLLAWRSKALLARLSMFMTLCALPWLELEFVLLVY